MEERSKVMAGTRYENQRRELDKSLKAKQDTLKAKHRQGGWCVLTSSATLANVWFSSMSKCDYHTCVSIPMFFQGTFYNFLARCCNMVP